jgi:hypothetical protein
MSIYIILTPPLASCNVLGNSVVASPENTFKYKTSSLLKQMSRIRNFKIYQNTIILNEMAHAYRPAILVLKFICLPARVKGCSCILRGTAFLKLQHPMKGLLLIRA